MAKKKIEETDQKEVKNDILKELNKKWGDILIPVSSVKNSKKIIVPVSPNIDIGLNGGVPEGSWVIISGPPKSGKSTLSLHLAAKAQMEEYGSRNVYYLDVEGRLKSMNLNGCKNLICEEPRFNIIASTEGNILSAEKFVNIGIDIIKKDPGCVLILDSASALCSSKELEEDVTGSTRALGPKILASFCRNLGQIVPINRNIVIIMQHMIANTSGYGPMYMEDGGRKLQYQSDIKLRFKGHSFWEEKESIIGQVANVEVVYSALGPPGQKVDSVIRYGIGIDEIWELISLACDVGIINKAGAWFNFNNSIGEEVKLQGQQKVWDYLNSNKTEYDFIVVKVKEMLA